MFERRQVEAVGQLMEMRAAEPTAAWKLSPENTGSSLRTVVKMRQALQTQLVSECKGSTLNLAGQDPSRTKPHLEEKLLGIESK